MLKNTGKSTKNTFKVGILGLGHVGISLKKLVAEKYSVFGRDLDKDEIGREKVDILHICIPYSDNFVKIVVSVIKELKPRLVLIESTVKIGATRRVGEKTNCLIAHSPVRGVHPHLYKGFKTFVKIIGGIDKESANEAEKYYQSLGLKTFSCISPETTELGKILSTTYYAWNIVFQKEAYRLCKKFGVDPGLAYYYFNQTYNQGYKELDMEHVVRPILEQMNGPIGGRCLIHNCKILEASSGNPITKFILKRNEAY